MAFQRFVEWCAHQAGILAADGLDPVADHTGITATVAYAFVVEGVYRTWLYVFDLPEDPDKQGDVILENLKTGPYGKCVYHCENNQPDHYMMLMEFEGGVTVNFSIEAFTSYGNIECTGDRI